MARELWLASSSKVDTGPGPSHPSLLTVVRCPHQLQITHSAPESPRRRP